MTFHTEGIILRRETWRETGRMYVIYTREAGKLLAVGRGTRKILSKLGAHLEPYSRVELFLARGRRHETIAGAKMTRPSEPFVADDLRHVAASFIAESFDQLVKWGDRDEGLWELLDGFYGALTDMDADEVAPAVAGYLWRFMDALGYGPRLHECMVCEKALTPGGIWFMPVSGAVSCRTCRPDERSLVAAEPVDAEGLSEIRDFLYGEGVEGVSSPTAIRAAHLFLEAHLDRPLMTQPLLRELMPLPKITALTRPKV